MSDKKQSGGMSVCGVLTLIFIVLKCLHLIDWKWIWVLSPIWIPLAVIIILCLIYLLLGGE